MTERVEEFRDWVEHAMPGQIHIYYTGFLAIDRGSIILDPSGELVTVPNGDIDQLARDAISAFENNRVYLFQRKIHDGVYQYIAFKRGRYGRNW